MIQHAYKQLLILTLLSNASAVDAQDSPVERDDRTKAVIASIESFAAAFNKADAKNLAAHFLPDGEFVDDSGTVFKGREDIEAEFAAFFKAVPGSQMAIDVGDIRFIGKTTAIEEGTTTVTHGKDSPAVVSRYIVVHSLGKNGWMIASARDLDSRPATHHDRLKPLSWLIGDWVDESDESTTRTSIRWSEDGNFIVTKFHVNVDGLRVMNGTQRIGWDPQRKQIRSWLFDSEGGFGTGFWTPTEGGWIVKASGVLPDGSNGSGTWTYSRTGPDSFRLTSSQRIIAGETQPVVSIDVVRKAPAPGK